MAKTPETPVNVIGEDASLRKVDPPAPPPNIENPPRSKPNEILYTDEIFERGLKTGIELGKNKTETKVEPQISLPPEPPKKKSSDMFGFGIEE